MLSIIMEIPPGFFNPHLALALTGLFSGFVDSIAGGGGLINLPVLTMIFGPGPDSIGTNKVAALVGACVALLVYARGGHIHVKKSLAFTFWIAFGSLAGSLVSPHLPSSFFRWILVLTGPVILWAVWRKDLWAQSEVAFIPGKIDRKRCRRHPQVAILVSGLICGFYDGVWGPGGGTFMFLSLLFFAQLPLLPALAASKLANTGSAAIALGSYAYQGHVHWHEGLSVASGISVGAWMGARQVSRNSQAWVRPVLVCVVVLLILKSVKT